MRFSRPLPNNHDVFSPVNYRPTEQCKVLVFEPTDGNRYGEIFDAVAVQYAIDERHPTGYHMVELPDAPGPFIRYIDQLPDGSLDVRRHKAIDDGLTLPPDAVNVLGYVFQFIHNIETGARWEFIVGSAHEGEREGESTRPLLAISGHIV